MGVYNSYNVNGITIRIGKRLENQIVRYPGNGKRYASIKKMFNVLAKTKSWRSLTIVAKKFKLKRILLVSGSSSYVNHNDIMALQRGDTNEIKIYIENLKPKPATTDDDNFYSAASNEIISILQHEAAHTVTLVNKIARVDDRKWFLRFYRIDNVFGTLGDGLLRTMGTFWARSYSEGIAVVLEQKVQNFDRKTIQFLIRKNLRTSFSSDVKCVLNAFNETYTALVVLNNYLDKKKINEKELDKLVGRVYSKESGMHVLTLFPDQFSRSIYAIGPVAILAFMGTVNSNISQIMQMGYIKFWKQFRVNLNKMQRFNKRVKMIADIYDVELKILRLYGLVSRKIKARSKKKGN